MVKSKLVSIERFAGGVPNAKQHVALDRASLQETMADNKAVAFGKMLENLVSVVPGSSTLQQSQDLLAFIRHAAETSYQELERVTIFR